MDQIEQILRDAHEQSQLQLNTHRDEVSSRMLGSAATEYSETTNEEPGAQE